MWAEQWCPDTRAPIHLTVGGEGILSACKHLTTLPPPPQYLSLCTIVNNCITLIGGWDISTGKVTNTLSTWYEEEEVCGSKCCLPCLQERLI